MKYKISFLAQQLKYDIRIGIFNTKRHALVLLLFSVLICWSYVYRLPANELPTVLDYAYAFFRGAPEFKVLGVNTIFEIPSGWAMFNFYLLYINAKYPRDSMEGFGMQVLIRAKNINIWWCSKILWTVIHTIFYYFFAYITIVGFTLFRGRFALFFSNPQIYEALDGDGSFVLMKMICIPLLGSIAICLLQTVLSFVFNSTISVMMITTILIFSVFSGKWFLVGNYLMLARIYGFEEGKLSGTAGILQSICIFVVASVVGSVVTNLKDFIKKKGS